MNWLLFQNSLLVATGATALSLGLGLAVALALTTLGRRGRGAAWALVVAAFALPPFVAVNAWLELLGPTGAWRSWLPLPIMSLPGTVWLLALMHWPVTTGFVWSAWQRIERETLEIDPLLRGAALWRWVLWPAARSAVLAAAATTFVLTLNQFTIPALLQVKVFPAEVWIGFNTTFNYASALSVGWPMLAVALAVLWMLGARARALVGGRWQGRGVSAELFRQRLGLGWKTSSWLGAMVAVGFSVGLPLGHLLSAPLTWKEFVPALEAGQAALGWSVGLAAGTATVVVLLGLVVGLRVEWHRRLACGSASGAPARRVSVSETQNSRRGRLLHWATGGGACATMGSLLLWLLFLVPGVVLGIGLIWALNRPATGWFYDGLGIVVLAWVLRYAAPGWAVLSAARERLDLRMVEQVRLEGGGRWAVFRFAVWPQLAPAAKVAAFVVFLFCLWDVETLVLIVPPGVETLALRVFNLLHYGHNSQVNALCLILLAVALAPLLVAAAFRALRGGKEGS